MRDAATTTPTRWSVRIAGRSTPASIARGAVVAAALLGAVLFASPAAFATPGVCDTAGNVEVESTGGPSTFAVYSTLRDAFGAINGIASPALHPQHTGTITIDVCGDSLETRMAELRQSGFVASAGFPPSSYTSVTIAPAGGLPRTIAISGTTNPNFAAIDLNGADNVTIDGLNTGGNSLTITSSVTGQGTLRLWNDATFNVIRNCSIHYSGSGTAGIQGMLFIGNAISVGNIQNTFEGNTIGSTGTTMAHYALRNDGSPSFPSTGIRVLNNNFFDYEAYGVNLPGGASNWEISGNRFYLTRLGTCNSVQGVRAINILVGGGYSITSNVIGHASAAGTGISTYSGTSCNFTGIYLGSTSGSASSIQGNTISAISMTTSSNGAGYGPGAIFGGIVSLQSSVDIGTVTGNTIGAATGTGAITINQSYTSGTTAYGIYVAPSGTGTVNVKNNIVGSIALNGTGSTTLAVRGIRVAGGSLTLDASSNSIGSATTPDSISVTAGVPSTSNTTVYGLYLDPAFIVTRADVNDNTFQHTTSNGATVGTLGIYVTSGTSPGTALSIQRNNILDHVCAGNSLNPFFGIFNSAPVGSIAINDNIIRTATVTSAAAGIRGIWQQAPVTGSIQILRNQLGNSSGGLVAFTSPTAATGEVSGITNTAGTSTATLSIQDNDIRGITYSVPAGASLHYYLRNTAGTFSQDISRNTFTNLNIASTGDVRFIQDDVLLPAGGSAVIDDNRIVTGFTKTGAGGTVHTYFSFGTSSPPGTTRTARRNDFSNISTIGSTNLGGWAENDGPNAASGGPTKTLSDNIFRNWSTGTGTIEVMRINFAGTGSVVGNNDISGMSGGGGVTGITVGSGNGGSSLSVSGNRIVGLNSTTASSSVTGITGGGGNLTGLNVTRNKIAGLTSMGTSGSATGILVSGNTTVVNVFDNIVGDLNTPTASASNPVIGINIQGSTNTINVDYNTVRLAASSSGATFGSSAVSVSTLPTVTFRNNIFANLSSQNGTGLAVAHRRNNAVLSTYGSASNNNDFYGARIFTDGTNTDTSLASYKTRVGPTRDSASINESPTFLSLTGSDPTFLHLNPTVASLLESGGIPIAVGTDYDNEPRHATFPDIGADEIVGRADLRVTKTDTPDPVGYSQTISYGVTVTNDGPHKAFDVALSDATPTGTVLESFTPAAGWSCSAPSPGASGSISCTTSSMAIGASAAFTLVVRVGECAENGTVIPSTATVTASTIDLDTSNNSATATTTTTGTPIACTPDANPCTLDVCLSGLCQHPLAPQFTACGDPDNTNCNAPDSCNTAGACVDRKKASGTVCQAGTGPCDENDVCDGSTNACVPVFGPNHVPDTGCFLPGDCAAGNVASYCAGPVEIPCATGSPTGADDNCNGVDENCSGTADEGYVSVATSCGVGACASTGSTSCVGGSVVDSCAPGTPAASDTTCDGIDDDCNGTADEDYVSMPTSCGVGACTSAGSTSCVGGSVVDSCAPGTPAASDTTCDGIDDNCNGTADEDYVSTLTSCGVGACTSAGSTSCVGGSVVDSCAPGTPAASDTTCDGIDDDCNGTADEGYVSMPTSCGVGACTSAGSTSCVGGSVVDSCAPGTPAASDTTCDGIDDDCNGTADEGYVSMPTSCGVGACASTGSTSCVGGSVVDSCAPGTPAASDTTCDGIDDDCNGTADEGYVSMPTSCGVGACASAGSTSCVGGSVVDSCAPGTPAASDTTCDGIDDDCNGTADEGYVSMPTSCGVGACASTGSTSCVGGSVVDSCAPGTPAASDTTCDGIDDDCNGTADEGYVSMPTSCGVGACASAGSTSCVGGSVVDSCAPGTPAASDTTCDGIDDDCNGTADEDYVSTPTTCGVGECASTGTSSCVGGSVNNTCTPGAPSPEICDGLDNDCDGTSDSGGGGPETCDGFDNDCDGIVDDGLSTVTITATRHIVGSGSRPTTRREPIPGLLVSVYDWAPTACAKTACSGSNQTTYACIYQQCAPVTTGSVPDPGRRTTNAQGQATFLLPPGTYLVLGGNGSGSFLSEHLGLTCGATQSRNLQEIVNNRGEAIAARETVRTGSRLTIIEPEEMVWNELQELYPYIFIAEGDWEESASIEPPEGFVSDYDSLSTPVWDGSTSALQFTITDVGSDWVPTLVRHHLGHNQRSEIVLSEVDVRLETSFAAGKGLDNWGRALGPNGEVTPEPLPPNPAGRLKGWIEAGPVDPLWVFEVELFRATNLSLRIESGSGHPVCTIVPDSSLEDGQYSFTWDRAACPGALSLEGLGVRIMADQVNRVYPLRRSVPPAGSRYPEVSLEGGN